MTAARSGAIVAVLLLTASTGGALGWSGRPYLAEMITIGGLVTAVALAIAGAPAARRVAPAVAPVLLASVLSTAARSDRGYLLSTGWGDPGLVHRAAVLTALGIAVLGLIAAGADVAGWIGLGVSAVGRLLTAIVGGATFITVILPAWVWSRLRRRDPLRHGRVTGWSPANRLEGSATSLATATEPRVAGRSLVGRITWALGCVTLVAAANYAAGWTWDSVTGAAEDGAEPTGANNIRHDPRVDSPALADAPWRTQYLRDLQRTNFTYWPFTESRSLDFRSEHINITGWERRTHQVVEEGAEVPTVWMLGGSTTWGEGQRDEYTIASWLTRLSDEDGVPVRMANLGQRGWTHFQEMVLFEQRTALSDPPDIALFYDGANEPTTQSLLEEAVPSHGMAWSFAQQISGGIATELLQEPDEEGLIETIYHSYSRHSLAHRIVGALRSPPAGAQDQPDEDLFTPDQDQAEDGGIYDYEVTVQDGRDAGLVYERGKALTEALSRDRGIEPLFVWQPMADPTSESYQAAIAQLSDSTVDLSEALLDHPEVFIDGGHTNEEGARLMAEAIWPHLRPLVEHWYADQ